MLSLFSVPKIIGKQSCLFEVPVVTVTVVKPVCMLVDYLQWYYTALKAHIVDEYNYKHVHMY